MKRLYDAVCGWLEASAEAMRDDEPQREGDNFSTVDLGRTYSADPEMHVGYRPQSIDDDNGATVRPISLKWMAPPLGGYQGIVTSHTPPPEKRVPPRSPASSAGPLR